MEVVITNKIKEKLDEVKQTKELSKSDIAKLANITRQSLNTISDSNNLTIKTLIKLSIVLNCEITDLFEYKIIKNDK